MTERLSSSSLCDVPYPATYQRELSPAWLDYAAAISGANARPLHRPFRYLELGCGQGLSTVIHAGAFPQAEFHACDVDASSIDSARRLAEDLGITNVTLHHATFSEMLGEVPERIPERVSPFDFIVAHGVYSWVDEADRASIRRVAARMLAPAGLVYVSYNCMPGWASEIPLRRLLLELADGSKRDAARESHAAVRALERLATSGAAYFQAVPEAPLAVQAYLKSPASYLAHELLGAQFVPFYSVDVADQMAAAGLRLLGSATLADNYEPLLIDDATAGVVAALPRERQRRLAMDFAVHRRFRRDLFVPAAPGTGDEAGAAGRLLIGCPDPSAITARVRVPRGTLTFDEAFVAALRELVESGAASMAQLVEALSQRPGDEGQVIRNLLYLVAAGELTPFARRRTVRPNARRTFASPTIRRAVERVVRSGVPGWVPSEITGGGVLLKPGSARELIQSVDGIGRRRGLPPADEYRLLRMGLLI